MYNETELKSGLVLNKDYALVLPEANDNFLEWYGKKYNYNEMKREVILLPDENGVMSKLVELW